MTTKMAGTTITIKAGKFHEYGWASFGGFYYYGLRVKMTTRQPGADAIILHTYQRESEHSIPANSEITLVYQEATANIEDEFFNVTITPNLEDPEIGGYFAYNARVGVDDRGWGTTPLHAVASLAFVLAELTGSEDWINSYHYEPEAGLSTPDSPQEGGG